jgi:hypothetical protein
VNENNNKIGVLWVQVKDQKAFIYDFVIDETFRGKGYGKQALMAMNSLNLWAPNRLPFMFLEKYICTGTLLEDGI